jgi:hypothetical protein
MGIRRRRTIRGTAGRKFSEKGRDEDLREHS